MLNIKLQGNGIFAHELFVEIKSFQVKMALYFIKQLSAQNLVHFPVLQTQNISHEHQQLPQITAADD